MHLKPVAENVPVQQLQKVVAELINQYGKGMLLCSGEGHTDPFSRYDLLAAIGAEDEFVIPFQHPGNDPLSRFGRFITDHAGWCFFHLTYDLKNSIENLTSKNPDRIEFPEIVAFTPKLLVALRNGTLSVQGDESLSRQLLLALAANQEHTPEPNEPVVCYTAMSKSEYLNSVSKVLEHIARGDTYELNYCQEFYGDLPGNFDPVSTFLRLSHSANAPFGAFYRWGDHVLCSASPERFLWRDGDTLISQPMKGTIRRSTDAIADAALRETLLADPKERAENVMIVDLVRNDLSRVAERGSVVVPELFGIYTFSKVHQMISTVKATLRPGVQLPEILKAAFPMGSMTGAPKISAMQITDCLERSRRGLYSGSVGYMAPNGDFDMNVVIRSLMVNLHSSVFSFQTGGAVTCASDPEKEYDECLLKAELIIQTLNARLFSE